jgi:hypothetical protein
VTLPDTIADLLWSYDSKRVDPQVNAKAVVMAVLRLGTWDQIRWLFSYYGFDTVQQIIKDDYFGARNLPVSIRAFWGNVFWPTSPPPELSDRRERWRPTRPRTTQENGESRGGASHSRGRGSFGTTTQSTR